jgi:hypothetical protein
MMMTSMINFRKMRLAGWIILLGATVVLAQGPRGTVPLDSAEKYPAHASQDGNSVGATLLTPSQAKKEFSSDLNRCCVAVEVALFPRADGQLTVSLNDFALRETGKEISSRPSSAEVVAGKLHRKVEPDHPGDRNVSISPTTTIGYESGGIDPASGQRRGGGVVTSTGVGVGVGGPRPPAPASSDADLRTMELELHEKGLPEGSTANPVAGYLYFSVPRNAKSGYELVYTVGEKKVVLQLK